MDTGRYLFLKRTQREDDLHHTTGVVSVNTLWKVTGALVKPETYGAVSVGARFSVSASLPGCQNLLNYPI